jgi:hypothetical protein
MSELVDYRLKDCVEIAKKLGWYSIVYPEGACHIFNASKGYVGMRTAEKDQSLDSLERMAWVSLAPTYFTDRNASAEIVQWFAGQPEGDGYYTFLRLLELELSVSTPMGSHHRYALLLATPRQIAEAALTVWGIGEGEAK